MSTLLELSAKNVDNSILESYIINLNQVLAILSLSHPVSNPWQICIMYYLAFLNRNRNRNFCAF